MVSTSRVSPSPDEVSLSDGVLEFNAVGEEGAIPKISEIAAVDLDAMFLDAIARARCLHPKNQQKLRSLEEVIGDLRSMPWDVSWGNSHIVSSDCGVFRHLCCCLLGFLGIDILCVLPP